MIQHTKAEIIVPTPLNLWDFAIEVLGFAYQPAQQRSLGEADEQHFM